MEGVRSLRALRAEQPRRVSVILADDSGSVRVEFLPEVIGSLRDRRQPNVNAKERGGQLFAQIDGAHYTVVEATGSRLGDRATPTSFTIDKRAAQLEIDQRYRQGLHFVGDWHTHPQTKPAPSDTDLSSINVLFRTSRHDLDGLILLIVGSGPDASAWYCSIHGASDCLRLHQVDEVPDARQAERLQHDPIAATSEHRGGAVPPISLLCDRSESPEPY